MENNPMLIRSTGNKLNYCSIPKDADEKAGLIYSRTLQENYRAIGGYLVDIQPYEDDYEGNTVYKIKFIFAGLDLVPSVCFTAGRYTATTRDILSSLAGLQKIGWVRLTPYTSSDPGTGKNYTHCSVRHVLDYEKDGSRISMDESKLPRAIPFESIPTIKKVKVGKKEHIDSSERDEFFDNLIATIAERLIYGNGAGQPDDDTDDTPEGKVPF